MREAYITLMQYYKEYPALFDGMKIPTYADGDTVYTLNRDLLINSIILKSGEFECLYNNPEFMSFAIGIWSDKYYDKWVELLKTLHYDYNPIHNYDRTETRNIESERSRFVDNDTEKRGLNSYENTQNQKIDDTVTRTPNLSYEENITNKNTENVDATLNSSNSGETSSNTGSGGKDTELHYKAAFNSDPVVLTDKIETDYGKTSNTAGTTTDTGESNTTSERTTTDTRTNEKNESGNEITDTDRTENQTDTGNTNYQETGSSDLHEAETIGNIETIKAAGNIGITSTQRMIELQRDIVEFNLYDYIADSFVHEFCIMVY